MLSEEDMLELQPVGRPGENDGRIVAEALLEGRAAVVIGTADTGHSVYKPWLTANSLCITLGSAVIENLHRA